MNIRPKFLYFVQEELDHVYTYTGNPDVNRMLTSGAYWKKSVLKEKPKTLILADWTARNWTYGYASKIQCLMNDLLAEGFTIYLYLLVEGFTIYLWQEDQLVPLTKDLAYLIHEKSVHNKMRLASDEEIQKKQLCNIVYRKKKYKY